MVALMVAWLDSCSAAKSDPSTAVRWVDEWAEQMAGNSVDVKVVATVESSAELMAHQSAAK